MREISDDFVERLKPVIGNRKIAMLGLPGKWYPCENVAKKWGV